MESADDNGFAEDVPIDRLHDGRTRICGLLRRRLRDVALVIHSEQFKRVVMIGS